MLTDAFPFRTVMSQASKIHSKFVVLPSDRLILISDTSIADNPKFFLSLCSPEAKRGIHLNREFALTSKCPFYIDGLL